MSEDEESGVNAAEGSPTSQASAYRYLDNNNLPSLPATAAPPPSPAAQRQRARGVRTMVVPPMPLRNNNSRGTEEHAQRAGGSDVSLPEFRLCFVTVASALVVSALQVMWRQ